MSGEIRVPTERTCQRCGREEVWDEKTENWVVEETVGDVYCIHTWDITGQFVPIE